MYPDFGIPPHNIIPYNTDQVTKRKKKAKKLSKKNQIDEIKSKKMSKKLSKKNEIDDSKAKGDDNGNAIL